jgi:hypothetical protein
MRLRHTWANIIRIDLQLRGDRKCRNRLAAVQPAFTVVGRWHRRRSYELGLELCRDLGPDVAFAMKPYGGPRCCEDFMQVGEPLDGIGTCLLVDLGSSAWMRSRMVR